MENISRQDAIDAIYKCTEYYIGNLPVMIDKADAYKALAELSSAQSDRIGQWVLKPNIYGVAYCSECWYELHTNNTNYCPNCGAKMKGENNATSLDI